MNLMNLGYFFAFLSIAFGVLAVVAVFKREQNGIFGRVGTKSVLQGFLFLFLFSLSLALFAYTQKPEAIQTFVFCFVGGVLILLIALGIMLLQRKLVSNIRVNGEKIFSKRKK